MNDNVIHNAKLWHLVFRKKVIILYFEWHYEWQKELQNCERHNSCFVHKPDCLLLGSGIAMELCTVSVKVSEKQINPESRKLVAVTEWLACLTAKQEVFHSSLALLKHACRESDWLLCWPYTPAKVSHHRQVSGSIHHVCHRQVQAAQRRHQQKSKTGVSVAPKMDMCPPKIKKIIK